MERIAICFVLSDAAQKDVNRKIIPLLQMLLLLLQMWTTIQLTYKLNIESLDLWMISHFVIFKKYFYFYKAFNILSRKNTYTGGG